MLQSALLTMPKQNGPWLGKLDTVYSYLWCKTLANIILPLEAEFRFTVSERLPTPLLGETGFIQFWVWLSELLPITRFRSYECDWSNSIVLSGSFSTLDLVYAVWQQHFIMVSLNRLLLKRFIALLRENISKKISILRVRPFIAVVTTRNAESSCGLLRFIQDGELAWGDG